MWKLNSYQSKLILISVYFILHLFLIIPLYIYIYILYIYIYTILFLIILSIPIVSKVVSREILYLFIVYIFLLFHVPCLIWRFIHLIFYSSTFFVDCFYKLNFNNSKNLLFRISHARPDNNIIPRLSLIFDYST